MPKKNPMPCFVKFPPINKKNIYEQIMCYIFERIYLEFRDYEMSRLYLDFVQDRGMRWN